MTKNSDSSFNYRVLNHPKDEKLSRIWQLGVLKWWLELESHKGERAALRRCANGEEAMTLIGYFRLKNLLKELPISARAIGSVAHLLAIIKLDDKIKNEISTEGNTVKKDQIVDRYLDGLLKEKHGISHYLGQQSGSDSGRPIFSTLRLQRLLQGAADGDEGEFDVSFRRAIRQLQGAVNTAELLKGKKGIAINPIIIADQIFYYYRSKGNPEKYRGSNQFTYQFAKEYYQAVFTYK